MLCFQKQPDGTLTQATCTADEELLCKQFCDKYTVRYRSATEGLYGAAMEPVTISEFIRDATPDNMVCILADGEVVGCVCEGRRYDLNGVRRHEQISGPGPQSALIWDIREWMLVEREKQA